MIKTEDSKQYRSKHERFLYSKHFVNAILYNISTKREIIKKFYNTLLLEYIEE